MKIRSLLLGSVAAAGLSTGAYAADLGTSVLTSLNICHSLGLTGLTLASDTNCLQISGGVSYEFVWGDYTPGYNIVQVAHNGDQVSVPNANGAYDWSSKVEAWLKFVGTAPSDFGPAKAVIKLKAKDQAIVVSESTPTDGSSTDGFEIDEAYVAIGDTTVIMAGKKGSIINKGDDVPLNFLGLFNSDKVDKGVYWTKDLIPDGGHVIQVVSDVGNGLSLGAGIENLNGGSDEAGTLVGVVAYAGDGIAAHLTVAAGGALDANIEHWGVHAGVSGSFDAINFVAAVAADDTGYWNALGSASFGIDMFTIAVSGEAASNNDYGVGASVSAGVADGVTLNVGGRWYHDDSVAGGDDAYQVAAQIVAAVTESITLTGEIGVYGSTNGAAPDDQVYYGSGQLAWAPGGGFTASVKGEVYGGDADGYKVTTKFGKTFE